MSGPLAPSEPPCSPDIPNRPSSIAEVEIHATYWVYARHHMREVRVVAKARTRVHVAFWTRYGMAPPVLVIQPVPYYALRRQRPEPGRRWGFVLDWPAPSLEEIAASVETIR